MAPVSKDDFFDLYKDDLLAVYVETRGCFYAIKEALRDFYIEYDEGYAPKVSEYLSYTGLPEDFSEYQSGEPEAVCSRCPKVLTEGVHIFCLSKDGEDEMTWCQECFEDDGRNARKRGWVFDEQGESLLDEQGEEDEEDEDN